MTKVSPIAAALSINPVFCGLDPDKIQQIADFCIPKFLSDGQTLFFKGEPGDALYGIRRGRILIRISTPEGKQLTIAIYGAGDIIGEIALLDGRPRTADAVALGRVEMFSLPRANFISLLEQQPSIALTLIKLLCDRLRATSDRLEEASLLLLSPRLARRLLKLADDFGEEVSMSQEELSLLVGASREAVNRQLQDWHRSGVIELGRSLIRITNMPLLQAKAAIDW
jgi:CRP/FNR family transcriptional regulator, cyclic AMP receptor protein